MPHFLAAIDLGSNSFRLSTGQVIRQNNTLKIHLIDQFKETVRLGAGIDANGDLSTVAIMRALKVLTYFKRQLRHYSADCVCAVATNTFRIARNASVLITQAQAALGFPIRVISGDEEASLIFKGVCHSLPLSSDKRLVIDIGGGSTEVVIGQDFEPNLIASLHMGCINYSQTFFSDGIINEQRMQAAESAARNELKTIIEPYRKMGWKQAFGSSGTAKALCSILTQCGFAADRMTRHGLEQLKKLIVHAGQVLIVQAIPGVKEERTDILAGGLAIMIALFDTLGIETMQIGHGALRVGVLHDLLEQKTKKTNSALKSDLL